MAGNFLNPELFFSKDNCYRVNPVNEIYLSKCPKNVTVVSDNPYMEEDLYGEDDDDEEYRIDTFGEGFIGYIKIPELLFKFIIGMKGATKKKVENETSTIIKVPSRNATGDIIITGKLRKDVCSAMRRIKTISFDSRMKLRANCFTCIPLITTEIKESFMKWKADVQKDNTICIDESYFQKPEKLHLTINIATILDDFDIKKANEILDESKLLIIDPILEKFGQIELQLKGVNIFSDENPSSTRVLFVKVISEQLQVIANKITESFVKNGLYKFQDENVKMHVTLLNTSFAPQEKRKPFDSSKLLQKYENYEFGSIIVKEIHFSKIGSYGSDGFYEHLKIINI